jgi:hypothetical protein
MDNSILPIERVLEIIDERRICYPIIHDNSEETTNYNQENALALTSIIYYLHELDAIKKQDITH